MYSGSGGDSVVEIIFYGRKGTSDVHTLSPAGGFLLGATDTVDITLTRDIGDLRKIRLRNRGVDGWRCLSITVEYAATLYTFPSPANNFLDKPDVSSGSTGVTGAGGLNLTERRGEMYEPLAPSGDTGGVETVELEVLDSSRVYRDPITNSESVPETVATTDGAQREPCFGTYDCGDPQL